MRPVVRLAVLLAWAAGGASAATLPDARVLLVDSARVERGTATLARIKAQAEAQRATLKPEQLEQGLELALSEILTALPDAVAAVAAAESADLVVQAAAWPEGAAAEPPPDATDQVIAELDRRLAQLEFTPP